ncbi:hypothetical protein MPDQ_002839 [Monascus purpureus]|uniref:non-specific serine/threonine protein kinase n=1 Tax=Monascus purpureus TaxID=5098 RepID=A0A507QJT4_MONPU|nr:hypothetical protein MPDQ_002839 [Monascus purpureus]BDD56748.1 hypothetical protein MAP00_002176 [Monascus purpureus]
MNVDSTADRNPQTTISFSMSNKAARIDGTSPQSTNDATAAHGSFPDIATLKKAGKEGIKVRLRRGSSKLLSFLGFRPFAALDAFGTQSGNASNPEEFDDSFHQFFSGSKAARSARKSTSPIRQGNVPVASRSGNSQRRSSDRLLESLTSPTHRQQGSQRNQEHKSQSQRITAHEDKRPSVIPGFPRSQSSPGLADLFSRKLSVAFGYPTIIRRTNLQKRPNIPVVDYSITALNPGNSQSDSTNGSSNPSTTPSGSGGSPVNRPSTLPTSEGPSVSPDRSKDLENNIEERTKRSRWNYETNEDIGLVEGTSHVSPSIVTVETVAAAKIFFETYFNLLFSSKDPRFQRQCALESHMYSLPLTEEEQIRTRNNWLTQERDYLRQCRILKTRSNRVRRGTAVSLAGYEVVKVLGKGSFGVVRLVKEKRGSESENAISEKEDPSIQRGELSNVKTTTLDALRSAVDSTKRCRRRILSSTNKEVFAMKVIRKSNMIRNAQEGHLRAERDFLVASENSRWIVPLVASFQDTDNLYLIMDFMVGGDFLGLLLRKKILFEQEARWYLAEIVLCVEEAHRLGWIHRDIKPDNFLISASGHLKISDFGLAFDGHWSHNQAYYENHRQSLMKKLGIRVDGDELDRKEAAERVLTKKKRRDEDELVCEPPTAGVLGWRDMNERRRFARSVVGTSQYMAPEVIQGRSYDGRCDWWSVGIILYECLYGFTPFAHHDRQGTKFKIMHHLQTLRFPAESTSDRLVSAEAIDLISQLLQEKEYRLCSSKYRLNDTNSRSTARNLFYWPCQPVRHHEGYYVYADDAADIKSHPFFRGIKWSRHHLSRPPWIPKVRGWEDTRYFDDNFDAEQALAADDENSAATNTDQETDAETALEEPVPDEATKPCGNDTSTAKASTAKVQKKPKEKKRPRDKILRDERVGKAVLEMRKGGSFLGYTYRRPKPAIMALSSERGRPFLARGQMEELFGY